MASLPRRTERVNSAPKGKSLLDIGLSPGNQINNALFQSVAALAGPATELNRKWLIIPSGVWTTAEPLIIPPFFSVYFEPGAKLEALPGFNIAGTSNGKTVSAVLSGPTDSSIGYWESCKIVNPQIDAKGFALSCIELWRHRFCEITEATLWNGLNHGLKLNAVSESTSYELTVTNSRIYNQRNAVNQPAMAGLEVQKCTDLEFANVKIIGYDYGVHETANCGANFYSTIHVWNRPTQGSLHRAFWFESSSGTAYALYADTPVARSTADPTLVDNAQDSYGFYIEGSGWTFNACKVFVNDSVDGNGYAYGGDNQTTGFFWASTAGSGHMEGCQFIGTATTRLKSAIAGPNAGSPTNIGPRYVHCLSGARATAFQRGIKFKSQGGPSFDFNPTDFDDGTGFGNLSVVMGAFPSPNGLPNALAIKQAWADFSISTGTTGGAGIRLWDATSNGGATPSAKVSHQIGVNTLNWLGHSTTGNQIQFIIGRQSAAATQRVLIGDLSTRANAAKSVFDFQAPVTFSQPIHLPRFTTAERNALGNLAQASSVIWNTTTSQWEYTDDGVTWRSVAPTQLDVVTQTAHGFVVGNWVRTSASGYLLAQANSSSNAEPLAGVVSSVTDTNTFTLQDTGKYGSGLTPGVSYFLSTSVAGAITTVQPGSPPNVWLPVGATTPSGELKINIGSGVQL